MQRGVLTLTKEELNTLTNICNIEVFNGTQLYEKFKSSLLSNEQEIGIIVSEDEIEKIMDEVGPPIYENQLANQIIEKINNLLLTLRPHPAT